MVLASKRFQSATPTARHAARGFSLMELMIVVAIVAILAAIAYPNYTDSVRRSNRSDGRAALMQAAQNLERYFTENNTYLNATIAEDPDTDIWATDTSTEGHYTLDFSVAPTATTYTLRATAIGSQALDTDCPALTLTHMGVRSPPECW